MNRMLVVLVVLVVAGISQAALGAVTNDKGRIIAQEAPRPAVAPGDPWRAMGDGMAKLFAPRAMPHSLAGKPAPLVNDKGRRL